MLSLRPISLKEANAFVDQNHRHHKKTQGWKFGVALEQDGKVVGVAIAGRPLARNADDGFTLEVTRVCTLEAIPNACSRLYGAIRRAAKALGYRKLITYTLESENGSSLTASGFQASHTTEGGSWSRPSRPRGHPQTPEPKTCWSIDLNS